MNNHVAARAGGQDLGLLRLGLLTGVIFLLFSYYQLRSGKVLTRYSGWVYRDQEPGRFWRNIAISFACHLAFIAYFVFKLCR